MKTLSSLVAVAAVFVASQAAAALGTASGWACSKLGAASCFTGPYHIDAPYKGSATVQLVGACKIAKVYADAQWGDIKDANNADVGEGLITKDGVLLAVVEEAVRVGGQESGAENDAAHKHRHSYFADLSSELTTDALQTLAVGTDCAMIYQHANPQARTVYDKLPATTAGAFNEKITVLYPFGGAFSWKSTTSGALTTDAQRKFVGKITFVGKRTITDF